MSDSLLNTIIAGAFALGGIIVGAGLTWLHSHIEYRRKKADQLEDAKDREDAILHGAFAVSNFLAQRLNEWDDTKNLYSLARSAVAQPYLAKLIDRSPHTSDRLMVSLVDLGLRLDALMFSAGFAAGGGPALPSEADLSEVEAAIEEMAAAVELVQLLLDNELPMMSDEELAEIVANPEDIPD